jgi:hypothetical protein
MFKKEKGTGKRKGRGKGGFHRAAMLVFVLCFCKWLSLCGWGKDEA